MSAVHYYIDLRKYNSRHSAAKITPSNTVAIMGYGRGTSSDSDIALQIINNGSMQLNDAQLWNDTHKVEAQKQYKLYRPRSSRMTTGMCINGRYPWLVSAPDDFTWDEDKMRGGQNYYTAPFSQVLPHTLQAAHEIRIAHMMATTNWTRAQVDYVCWTPSGSFLKSYTQDTVLVSNGGLTIRDLWERIIFPRLESFWLGVLKPMIESKRLEDLNYNSEEYVAITDEKLLHKMIL